MVARFLLIVFDSLSVSSNVFLRSTTSWGTSTSDGNRLGSERVHRTHFRYGLNWTSRVGFLISYISVFPLKLESFSQNKNEGTLECPKFNTERRIFLSEVVWLIDGFFRLVEANLRLPERLRHLRPRPPLGPQRETDPVGTKSGLLGSQGRDEDGRSPSRGRSGAASVPIAASASAAASLVREWSVTPVIMRITVLQLQLLLLPGRKKRDRD